MAKKQAVDVWIVESNTVYRQVPFTVVIDWVQQGRLLEEDMLRPSGATEWLRLGSLPAFAAYLPKAELYRAEDKAEALEPVQVDFAWKRRVDEDEDVDMIPLIDVSLVLLIFFMMTASVATAPSHIPTPNTSNATLISSDANQLWIGIDKGPDGQPVYSFGQGSSGPRGDNNQNLSQGQVLQRLDETLKEVGQAEVRIKAHRQITYDTVRQMTVALESFRAKGVRKVFAEVSERTAK